MRNYLLSRERVNTYRNKVQNLPHREDLFLYRQTVGMTPVLLQRFFKNYFSWV